MSAELLEKCRAATGPDRKLDAEISVLVRYSPFGPDHWIRREDITYRPARDGWVDVFDAKDELRTKWNSPAYTGSIDAAVSLINETFPDHMWGIARPMELFRAYIVERSPLRPMPFVANCATPALALVCAFLSAKLTTKVTE